MPDIQLCGRLGEREVVGAQPDLGFRAEHLACEVLERATEVRHAQVLVDGQALELVEHRGVRRIKLIRAEHLARAQHVDGQFPFQHGADLHGRGVRAHEQVGLGRLNEERVLHVAGRVVRLEVQGIEVEPLRLDLGPFGDFPTHADKDVGDAVLQRGQRVACAGPAPARRRRDVHGLFDEDPRVVLGFELGRAVRERLVDASPRGAHEFAGGGLLVFGERADLTVGEAQRGLFAGVREAHGLEFIEGRGGGDGGNCMVYGSGNGGFIQRIRDGGARQSFSHLLFLATSRITPTPRGTGTGHGRGLSAGLIVTVLLVTVLLSLSYGTVSLSHFTARPAGIPPAGTSPV